MASCLTPAAIKERQVLHAMSTRCYGTCMRVYGFTNLAGCSKGFCGISTSWDRRNGHECYLDEVSAPRLVFLMRRVRFLA